MDLTVGLHLYSVHFAEHGLDTVARASAATSGLGGRVLDACPQARGVLTLSTCNRVEVYVDARPGAEAAPIAGRVSDELGCAPVAKFASEAIWHLFEVAAGLDSMVVGEREIAGQLRRSLAAAHRERTSSFVLTESAERALRTSRRVATATDVSAHGRSVVAVGLDLLRRDWTRTRALLVGTGAYAGAVVAALRARGCPSITVHSGSGRADQFAQTHRLDAASGSVADALAEADVVVTCRGRGVVFDADSVAEVMARRPGDELVALDLSVQPDVDAAVGALPGVLLVDLAVIQRHVPEASAAQVARAHQLVAEGVSDLLVTLRGRQMDPTVVALRETVTAHVDDEIARLPAGRPISAEEAAHALRRLAARLVHVPSVRARKAAEEGRGASYLAALSEVYGINAELYPEEAPAGLGNLEFRAHAVQPETLDSDECPVTGLSLSDIGLAEQDEEAI